MKKITLTIATLALAFGAFAQGTVYTLNSGAGLGITTNNSITSASGLISGAGNYYFALLTQTSYAPTASQSAIDGSWTFTGVMMTNIASAGVENGGAAVVANNWSNNTTNYYIVVGWSANLGNSWSSISNQLATSWSAAGYYGVSAVGDGEPGGGTPSLGVWHLFGTTASAQGTPVTGFALNYVTPVPEPTTLALAGLGGLSMLLFRRKKA